MGSHIVGEFDAIWAAREEEVSEGGSDHAIVIIINSSSSSSGLIRDGNYVMGCCTETRYCDVFSWMRGKREKNGQKWL